jgi:competence protein ComQ
MTIFLSSLSEHIRLSMEKTFYKEELRRLGLRFVEHKLGEKCVFGQLTSLHCRMFGGNAERAYAAAAAIELMILALDIYDDLQDRDNETVPWSHVDPALALNAAIGLQALSIDQMRRIGDWEEEVAGKSAEAADILNRGVLRAVNGQHMDLLNESDTEEECLRMIADKSGVLVSTSCLVGTVMATDEHHELVTAYGEALGIAAQIRNDIAGIERWDLRNDLLFRKRTLPILYVLEQKETEALLIRDYYEGNASREDLLARKTELMSYIRSCGCIEYAEVHARLKRYEAEAGIVMLPVAERWKAEIRRFM